MLGPLANSGRQPRRRRRPQEDPAVGAGEDAAERQVRDHLVVAQRRHRRLRPQRELHVHLSEEVTLFHKKITQFHKS